MKQRILNMLPKLLIVSICSFFCFFSFISSSFASPNHISTVKRSSIPLSLSSIVCSGQKDYAGWSTYPTGGYSGCGGSVDYVITPTNHESTYSFGGADGNTYDFQAWIPIGHATANMDFHLTVCGNGIDLHTVNEAPVEGWVDLFTDNVGTSNWCDIEIWARSNMVSSGYYLGLSAIRAIQR